MHRITKDRMAEWEGALAVLEGAWQRYLEAAEALKIQVEVAVAEGDLAGALQARFAGDYKALKEKSDEITDAHETLTSLAEGYVEEMTSYADDRSDKWQESEAGDRYRDWISAWENAPELNTVTWIEHLSETSNIDMDIGGFEIIDPSQSTYEEWLDREYAPESV